MQAIPTLYELQCLCTDGQDNTNSVLRLATLSAIYAAAASITSDVVTTGAIAKGSATGPEVEELLKELQEAGLSVTNGSTTFTVSWQI